MALAFYLALYRRRKDGFMQAFALGKKRQLQWWFPALVLALLLPASGFAADVQVAVLRVEYPRVAPISRLEESVADLGFAGGSLADQDNQTTGRFLGHTFATTTKTTTPEQAVAALEALQKEGFSLFVVISNDTDLLRLADKADDKTLILNANARATRLRDRDCRANVLHIAPSNAMLADAVAQFTIWKRWPRWLLVHGSNPADTELANAYRKAAKKFGAQIVEEREIKDTGGARRTDTGHVLVQRQIPVLMQDAKAHDVVIAADASDVFAPYLPYHLWTPRPVLGASGLRPVTFHPTHEAWGATQFQRRFEKLSKRLVRDADYNTWLALRVLGEAAIRTGSADPEVLKDYILSDAFELAAFKGQKVTFRNWNGQLRQPILLFDGRITASVSPQDGFLHQRSLLDTLGLDQPESQCKAF